MELQQIMVLTEVTSFGQYNLSGYTLKEVVANLQSLLDQYPDGKVEFQTGYDGDSDRYLIMVPRLETHTQCIKRMKLEADQEATSLAYRRRQFEALQKEFEPKVEG